MRCLEKLWRRLGSVMGKARREIVKVSISELLASILGESYAPREIVEENRLIHYRLGLDGEQEYSIILGGIENFNSQKSIDIKPLSPIASKPLCLVFKPDAVRDGVVYELKVLRRFSDRDRLMVYGFLQLQLELYALGLTHGKLLFYKVDGGVLEEMDVAVNPSIAEEVLAFHLGMLEARGKLLAKLLDESRVVKR